MYSRHCAGGSHAWQPSFFSFSGLLTECAVVFCSSTTSPLPLSNCVWFSLWVHSIHIYAFHSRYSNVGSTEWPEILAGRYFGVLLKLWHLAEFTLAVEKIWAIMIFIAKWLTECAGNLTGPWASFDRPYHSDAETENRLPIFLDKCPTTTPALVFTTTKYTSFGLRWQANFSPTSGCPKPFGDVISSYAAVNSELHADDYSGVSSCRPILHVEAMITNNDDSTL